MVTTVEVLTGFVFTVNVALVAPAATDALAGTVATVVLPLESWTTAPPAEAALVRVAVPCEVPPPITLVGFKLSEDKTSGGGLTVNEAVGVVPP